DVEIRVARRQTVAIEIDRSWHRQRDHFRLRSIFQPQVADALPVLGERAVVCILAILLLDQYDGPWIHEAADVVDMAVRVVAFRSPGQPEDVRRAEIRA